MDREELRWHLANRYVLISCEGSDERVIVRRLIDAGRLVVPRDHLIEDEWAGTPYTMTRSARDIAAKFLRYDYPSPNGDGQIVVARVTDKEPKKGKADKALAGRAIPIDFITRPEIETLVVIAEGAQQKWERARSRNRQLKISEFCKGELGLPDVKKETFLVEYWSDVDKLVRCIRELSLIHI